MVLQSGVADALHFLAGLQPAGQLQGIVHGPLHAQGQRFYALQDEQGVERRQAAAKITQDKALARVQNALLPKDSRKLMLLYEAQASESCGKRPLFQSKVPASARIPAMLLPWPPSHLVAECVIMAAPCRAGWNR